MKTLFTLVLALVVCLQQLNAQAPASAPSYKPVAIFYNANWEVTKKENAAFSRIAYLPERLKDIPELQHPKFNGPIRDYFADGTLWASGNYNEGRKWGEWNFYYANGQPDCKGQFDGNWPKGKWQFWYPNGALLMEASFEGAAMYLHSFWNAAGEQTIKNGTGAYSIMIQDESGREMKIEGAFVDGKQSGTWTYGPVDGPVEVTQDFSNMPVPAEGKIVLGYTNRFDINPVPNYLVRLEDWKHDNTVYEETYPVVADVVKSEVQRINIKETKNVTADHYYRIVQQVNPGIDTLDYGMPVIHPDLRKFHGYIERNFRFPDGLKGASIKGTMLISFTIKTDGSIANVRIIKSLSPALDEVVVKLFKSMPVQKPATLYTGKPVESNYTYPIRLDVRSSTIESEFRDVPGRSTGGRVVVTDRGYN